jgi:hypothetical protein
MEYYEHRLPCDTTQIGRFSVVVGEAGLEQLLKATINTAVDIKAVKPEELERVIVDITVQEKAIAHPVDSRLIEIARHKVVSAARRAGIVLKQTYARQGKARRFGVRPTLRTRQAVQAPAPCAQAPAHDPGRGHARGAAQVRSARVRHRQPAGADRIEDVARTRRAHPHAAASRQEQAVRAARARGRVHRQRQGEEALGVRGEDRRARLAPAGPDAGRAPSPATRMPATS